jgi:hypothetical protein
MKEPTRGNSHLPDFHELNDRIIAEPSTEPRIVIKTNLDTQNVREENPYAREENKLSQEFQVFFEGENK